MAMVDTGILDAAGRPIRRAALKREQAAPSTTGVRQPYGDHPAAGLTPGRLARLLRDSIEGDPVAYLELAEDIEERDLHYAGVLSTRKRQVAELDVTVDAASDDARDVAAADLVREVLDRDAFQTEVIDILDAIGKGYSATEIVWDTSEGQWRPRALKWRDPRWFTFDRVDGETPMLREIAGDVALNPGGWIFHTANAKSGLPVRGGLARAVAWAFLFKAFTLKDWAIFCEAYGQPLRIGKYDGGATEADKAILLRALGSIGVDYAAMIPNGMAIEFVEANVAGTHELYEKRADWIDRQISKLVLGQTATTDAIAGGHAVGKTHDKVRGDIEAADARQLAATLNRDLVVPLVGLNFGPMRRWPRIRIGRPDEVDVDALVKNVVQLVPLGLRVGMSTMRDKLGLPDPEDGEEVLAPAPPPAAPGAVGDRRLDVGTPRQDPADRDPPARSVNRTMPAPVPAATRDAIDDAVARIVDDGWEAMVGPIVDAAETALAGVTTEAEAATALAAAFRAMSVDELAERLARAGFAARIAGLADEPLT